MFQDPARNIPSAAAAVPVWAMAEPKAGMMNQVTGLAAALGLPFAARPVTARGLARRFAPFWPAPAPPGPYPALVLACGRQGLAAAFAVRRANGGRTRIVATQSPRVPAGWLDLIIPPEHDGLAGPNVFPILGSPHRITPSLLAEGAQRFAPLFAALPHPRVAVLIGGDSKAHRLPQGRMAEIVAGLRALRGQGAGLMVTVSRRTPPEALDFLTLALADDQGVLLWDGTGENPYLGMLGLADAVLVTADSTNMAVEAAATGKPVFIVPLDGGARKFDRFHGALMARGIARPFEGRLESWRYFPLDETARAAAEIRRRFPELGGSIAGEGGAD